MSSDYSPMEDEDSEEDEIEVVSLLSDESDEERVRVKRKRVQRNRLENPLLKERKYDYENQLSSTIRDLQSELTKPASNDDKDHSDAILGETVSHSTAVKCAANAPKNTICTQPANTSDDAGVATNVSDMGTVELKCKENTDIENNAIETCNSTSGKQEDAAQNANDDSKRVDISEAETEILEYDEVDTYNVSLGGGSGDGVSESNTLEKSSLVADGDSLSHKPDGAASETETVHSNNTAPAPTNEVQHFFDFVPLKSKPKVKTTSFSTLKPLPIHSHTITCSSVEKENETCVKDSSKTNPVVPTKPSLGSNGLRQNRKTIGYKKWQVYHNKTLHQNPR
ncbi:hypothetical protein PsorP6_003096 [Peronosclerospora sorghi]|uniref:Uncharacterized protein n=1 Tax=Peronosclerospora sorghi TaxID=230839 RepID=A0ACC0VMF0_9STRA|nr:hypothetical protein PsorP6_003096 [Peronosclerospora sorghi]